MVVKTAATGQARTVLPETINKQGEPYDCPREGLESIGKGTSQILEDALDWENRSGDLERQGG